MRFRFSIIMIFILAFSTKQYAQDALTRYYNLYKSGNINEALGEINRLINEKGTDVSSQYYYLQAELYQILYTNSGKQNEQYLENSRISINNALKATDYNTYKDNALQIAGIIARDYYKNGVTDYNKESYQSAQADFLKAVELFDITRNFSELHKLYYLLAFSAKNSGDEDIAIKYLQILIDNNYNDENVYLYLSDMYRAKGELKKSIEIMQKAAEMFGTAESYYGLISAYYQSGNKDTAMMYVEKFSRLNIYDKDISMIKGSLYFEKNNLDSAVTTFKKVVEKEPDHPEANYNAGIILYNQGMSVMKYAETNYYDYPDKYRAEKDKYLEKIKEAVPYLEKAYKLDNQNINVSTCLLDIYKRLQRSAEYESLKSALDKTE